VRKALEVEGLITTEDNIEMVGMGENLSLVVIMTVEQDVIELKF
jgi:hypothetical protein